MGCDIHCHIEVKKNDQWIKYAPLIENPYYDPERPENDYNKQMVEDRGYDSRNYNLFAILANVRNGRGFAGIKTGDGFNPISMPKGLPNDVSAEVNKDSEEWGPDGHSHSWLMLSEILGFDWEQVTTLHGILSAKEFESWDRKTTPQSYCRGISGPNIIVVSMQDYLNLVKEEGKEYYVKVDWVVTYRDAVGNNWWKAVDRLKEYVTQFQAVRLVFWFDN